MSYFDLNYLKELNEKKNFENSTMSAFKLNVGCRELFQRKFF